MQTQCPGQAWRELLHQFLTSKGSSRKNAQEQGGQLSENWYPKLCVQGQIFHVLEHDDAMLLMPEEQRECFDVE